MPCVVRCGRVCIPSASNYMNYVIGIPEFEFDDELICSVAAASVRVLRECLCLVLCVHVHIHSTIYYVIVIPA